MSESELPDWASRLVVFDTETTGLDLGTARIVTACVAEIDASGTLVGEAREWLINPGVEIPEAASNVHGVTTALAIENGASPTTALEELIALLRGYLDQGIAVVAYNAPYDFTILHNDAIRNGVQPLQAPSPVLDPLVIDKFVDRYRKGKRNLSATAEYYGVALSNAHNATADAVAAGLVMQAIARRYAKALPNSLAELHGSQIAWSQEQALSFADWKRRSGEPNYEPQLGWPTKK